MSSIYAVTDRVDNIPDLEVTDNACLTRLTTEVKKNPWNRYLKVSVVDMLTGMISQDRNDFYRQVVLDIGWKHHMGKEGFPTEKSWMEDDYVVFDLYKVNNNLFNGFISEIRLNEYTNLENGIKNYLKEGFNSKQAYFMALFTNRNRLFQRSTDRHHHLVGGTCLGNVLSIGKAFKYDRTAYRGYSHHTGANRLWSDRVDRRYKDWDKPFVKNNEEPVKNIETFIKVLEVLEK